MRIAVCDDEEVMRKKIRGHLEKMNAISSGEIEEFEDGMQLLNRVLEQDVSFDILLLDIHMKGISGIETAKRIREQDKKVVIIFITSIVDYVFSGYEVKAFRYLMKPLKENDFLVVMQDAIDEIKEPECSILLINDREKAQKILLKEITYVEIFVRKVFVHTVSDSHEFYGKINELEKRLWGRHFIKVHRSCIVNASYISSIDKKQCLITINDDKTLPVSRDRIKNVCKELTEYSLKNWR